MKNKNLPIYETLFILIGELIVSLITAGVYLIINKFSYKVITGAALGTAVTVLNFLFLAISTNRAFDKAIAARGTKEMDEEEAEAFAKEQQKELNNAIKLSFIIRNVTMLATLVVAFVLDWFDVIATLVPLVMLRPIITVEAIIRGKIKKGDS
jgi:hypothetical protein